MLECFELGILQLNLLIRLLQFILLLHIQRLLLKQGSFLLNQEALEFLVLVLDGDGFMLKTLHLGHRGLLEAFNVFFEAILHDLFLLFDDLSDGELLV